FQQLAINYRAEKQITAKSLVQTETLQHELTEAQNTIQTQQQRLNLLQAIIGDLKSDLQQSEKRCTLLQNTLLSGDQLESQRIESLVKEYSSTIEKLRRDVEQKEKKLKEFH